MSSYFGKCLPAFCEDNTVRQSQVCDGGAGDVQGPMGVKRHKYPESG